MFDARTPVEVTITSGGKKSCVVRFPTDEEWIRETRQIRTIKKSIGRGSTQSTVEGAEEAAAELFAAIRTEGDEPFDAAEATRVLDRLRTANEVDCRAEGDRFVITLDVFRARVKLVLRTPLAKDVDRYGRTAMVSTTNTRKRQVEIQSNLKASADLFDSVFVSAEGYAEGCPVPIVHKDAATSILIDVLDQASGDEIGPEA